MGVKAWTLQYIGLGAATSSCAGGAESTRLDYLHEVEHRQSVSNGWSKHHGSGEAGFAGGAGKWSRGLAGAAPASLRFRGDDCRGVWATSRVLQEHGN